MNSKYKRILAGIHLLNGQASIDELARATGISNRDINNALRTIEPEFVEVTGTKSRRGDGRDDPKVLTLTDAGEEIGKEAGVAMNNDEPLWTLRQEVEDLRMRVAHVEEANAKLERENQRFKNLIRDLL